MSLLATLRKRQSERIATATLATVATQEGGKGRTVANVATVAVAYHPRPGPETISAWWLLHFADKEPAEVWAAPPATHAAILEQHPEAIAAEPFNPATPEPARACSTCAHITGRGGCGEPVVAGLSHLEGVIRYHPHRGAGCPAWLAILDGELERRILAMAERWGYTGDELALALDGARSDPEGWRRVVELDEG